MKRCATCSHPLEGAEDRDFCPACGAVLDKPKPKPKPAVKKTTTKKKSAAKKR